MNSKPMQRFSIWRLVKGLSSRPRAQFPRLFLDLARGPTQKPGYLFNGHSALNRGPQEE
jgi:hypothetical protein